MATDIDAIIENLTSFYAFSDKSVLHVGAGNGQLIGYAPAARSVVGIDSDEAAVARLETAVEELGLQDRFQVEHGDFLATAAFADVVFFEFCLHEMSDPLLALTHALELAPEIVVLDHLPDSRWAWHACETEKAQQSWAAVRSMSISRMASFKAVQHFDDHAQLRGRIEELGQPAIDRAASLAGQKNIAIDMTYAAALVKR